MTDKAWSQYCLKRDRHYCRVGLPGCRGRASGVHHIFGRTLQFVRTDPDNGISVCASCHEFFEEKPTEGKLLAKKVIGRATWLRLVEKVKENSGLVYLQDIRDQIEG